MNATHYATLPLRTLNVRIIKGGEKGAEAALRSIYRLDPGAEVTFLKRRASAKPMLADYGFSAAGKQTWPKPLGKPRPEHAYLVDDPAGHPWLTTGHVAVRWDLARLIVGASLPAAGSQWLEHDVGNEAQLARILAERREPDMIALALAETILPGDGYDIVAVDRLVPRDADGNPLRDLEIDLRNVAVNAAYLPLLRAGKLRQDGLNRLGPIFVLDEQDEPVAVVMPLMVSV